MWLLHVRRLIEPVPSTDRAPRPAQDAPFSRHPNLPIETPWLDWPEDLRATYDLDSIPQEPNWRGWDVAEPLEEKAIVAADDRLGRFLQQPAAVTAAAPPAATRTTVVAEVTGPPNLVPPLVGELPRPAPLLAIAPAVPAPEPAPKRERPFPGASIDEQPVQASQLAATVVQLSEAPDLDRTGNPFDGVPDDEV